MRSSGPSLLVVDDDVGSCLKLFNILADLGYQVATVIDGPAALELLRRDHYDLALVGWRVDGVGGLSLCRAARASRAGTEVLVLADAPSDVTPEQARAAGVRQVLVKPLNLPRLLALLRQATGLP
jgi:DNA-binding response OmpR family regulator